MRVLIAIGCDAYDNPPLQPLAGAENDAATIFEHLVAKNWGGYDQTQSKLLRSPTMAMLRSTVDAALFSGTPIEELTFFFAGHGGVKDNSYFLCLRDSDVDRMSLNALSMTQLFGWITEAKIRHTNLIVDACHAGGVVHDIGVLLNPNVIGKVGSLAISILAAAGSDEYAGETNGAGHCTSALMSCLKGETSVQTTRPSLDLVEVGQVVSRVMQGTGQSPVCWGINLFGISQLAKNPRFSGGGGHISETFPGLAPDGVGNEHIRAASDAIWEQYLSLTREFDAERFLDVIQPVCANLEGEPAVAAAFIKGLAATFGPRIAATGDYFNVARLQSACAVALLPMAASSTHCADAIMQLSKEGVAWIDEGTDQLLADFTEDTYALLSKDGGIADFYFLPLRLMSILGWLGAAVHIQTISGESTAMIAPKAADLVRLIMAHYSNSVVPVSDEMTPFYVSFAAAANVLGCEEELESISGLLLRILHQQGGWIAEPGLSGEDALRFLTAVTEGRCDDFRNILANPTSLLPAVLLVMDRSGLADIADGAMKGFDHTNINIFVPNDFSTFGASLIEEGTNFSLNIGHTVFSVSDLVAEWSKIEEHLSADAILASPAVRISSVLASLLRPDRVAWFLVAGQSAKTS
ncbi:caspase domain-containing protein [Rhodopseudomonas thermotolerans]|uniref:Caspase domain-containing protein n=2 Tax=Rhodopseudomonas TaxID=1073 RepID=A0A336JJL9_9BRAD|nr:caspase domain-containing protein [Rhodopseudomonas pentothenatexigens]REG06040.1 caspase domain-containing protein [Rhodopseudomonas thermotolerans]SSW89908.1 caspase domain-containing protein [Rhodopseudomonas pentothenatexigens]